jgi:hypothetical protein
MKELCRWLTGRLAQGGNGGKITLSFSSPLKSTDDPKASLSVADKNLFSCLMNMVRPDRSTPPFSRQCPSTAADWHHWHGWTFAPKKVQNVKHLPPGYPHPISRISRKKSQENRPTPAVQALRAPRARYGRGTANTSLSATAHAPFSFLFSLFPCLLPPSRHAPSLPSPPAANLTPSVSPTSSTSSFTQVT